MSTVQGNLIDHNGNKVAVNTLASAIYDAAKQQALSATLAETPDKRALGYPSFATITPYPVGKVVFHNNTLWRFTSAHEAGAWNADEVEPYSVKDLADDILALITALGEDIQDGTITAALAENIKSWAERSALSVNESWTDHIRTTAGDQSVDSAKGARLISIIAQTDFAASALKTTGFNLLRNATAVGDGFYFLVPALPFGVYGMANQPNGILFTDNNGGKLTPTVRFKALGSGVPSSTSDGSACAYTDSHGYRFYTTDQPGYIIVSGIAYANTCAHIAWSRRYDDFVSPTAEGDAGSSISLSSILAAIHSDVSKLLVVGSGAAIVSDRIDFDGTKAVWTRKVARVKPTWTRSDLDAETGLYTYTATISGMAANGLAEFESGNIELAVDGTTISYQSEDSTAVETYVKYQLATTATGNVTTSNELAIDDWGLEMLVGASGTAIVNTQYAQSYPDAVAQLLANIDQATVPIICATFAQMQAEIDGLKAALYEATVLLKASFMRVNAGEYFVNGVPKVLRCSVAGAPAAARVPDNWDEKTMGVWTGVPYSIEQIYMDEVNKKVYAVPVLTNSTSDWVLLN
jgi:hypothetical protein